MIRWTAKVQLSLGKRNPWVQGAQVDLWMKWVVRCSQRSEYHRDSLSTLDGCVVIHARVSWKLKGACSPCRLIAALWLIESATGARRPRMLDVLDLEQT